MAAVKNLPASECGPGVKCISTNKEEHVISSNAQQNKFTLWRIVPGVGYEKMQTAASPLPLYEKIPNFVGTSK